MTVGGVLSARLRWVGLVVIVLLASWASLMPLAPPSVPQNAPDHMFSAARAMVHVRALSESPRPVGSRRPRLRPTRTARRRTCAKVFAIPGEDALEVTACGW